MSKARLFRHIQLKIGKLELGAPLPETIVSATGTQHGAREVRLPTATFGKAQTITLHLTPSGLLQSASFEYRPDGDFEQMIGDYVSLGEPTRESSRRGGITIDIARWSDADTELTLTREIDAGGSRIRGELRDQKAAIG